MRVLPHQLMSLLHPLYARLKDPLMQLWRLKPTSDEGRHHTRRDLLCERDFLLKGP